jgi:hypothetical protein
MIWGNHQNSWEIPQKNPILSIEFLPPVPAIDKSAGQKTLARRASEDVEIVISVTLVYALNPQEKMWEQ